MRAEFGGAVALGVHRGVPGHPPLAVVGAPGTSASRGAVYLYTRPGPAWIGDRTPAQVRPVHWASSPTASAGDRFGAVLDMSGDLLLVGSPGDRESDGRGLGSAYVFSRAPTPAIGPSLVFAERGRLRRRPDTRHTRFAGAGSISAGVVLIGADRDIATDSGSVFFYE